jgi:membrane fusion protein (multidrug efflux system)
MHDIVKPKLVSDKADDWLSKIVIGGIAFIAILVLVVVPLGFIKGLQIFKIKSGGPQGMPPTTVTSAEVKQENWAPLLSAVGSISAVQGAVVSTELPGTVAEVAFESGATVKKGDLLVRLDTSAEDAQLRAAVADVELARADL